MTPPIVAYLVAKEDPPYQCFDPEALPLACRQLGAAPTYASSPFVATVVDVTGIVIYFTIAKIHQL